MSYKQMTEAELSAQLADGDQLAFTEVYNRYWYPLYNHACALTQDAKQAEDILQDVFLAILNNMQGVNPSYSLSGYLFTCVRNKFLNHIRNDKVRGHHLEGLQRCLSRESHGPDAVMIAKEMNSLLEKEIARMPEKMRLVFELSRKNQLSYTEISAKVGSSEGTVKKQIHLALRLLKGRIIIPLVLGILMMK